MQAMLELLRQKMNNNDRSVQWMAALKDQSIWAALQAMMERPGDPHSVESLADIAGMSRSAFAQRFSAAYGSGPLELLRNIRMQQAATLLSGTDLPVKRIAEKVGFRSRSAFSRMFETIVGQSPRAYRQSAKGQ
ncbi:MAG: AraC family transcriptional regulator, partial [Cohaesibacter sp.]|nr:AraC family transcriptional regulator [Cohaesibacter sp.]